MNKMIICNCSNNNGEQQEDGNDNMHTEKESGVNAMSNARLLMIYEN